MNEDEMFLVIGELLMQLEHKTVEINAGEFVVIPKKKTIGQLLLEVLLFEPNTTVNTETLRTNLQLETSIKSNKSQLSTSLS
jgi:hypothetical protein